MYLLHGRVLSSYVLQMFVWKAYKLQGYLCIAREYVWCDSDECILQGLYRLGMFCWDEYWLPKYCRGIFIVERTTDFATLQEGHVLALYVLEVVDVHVGQGVVKCTVWRTDRCILEMHKFRKSLRWLGLHSKVFVSKRYINPL